MQKRNKTLIWLDDVRDPFTQDWISKICPNFFGGVLWLKTYDEFVKHIQEKGVPTIICFDHDLGDNDAKTGYDAAKWLTEYCQNNDIKLPDWRVQSANPVGKDNINYYLRNYIKHIENDN